METEEESKFTREIEILQKHAEYSIDLQDKTLKSSYTKILEDYEKALEDDYLLKSKSILKEIEIHSSRDVKKFISDLENEKNILLANHKSDISEMEKEYFSSN